MAPSRGRPAPARHVGAPTFAIDKMLPVALAPLCSDDSYFKAGVIAGSLAAACIPAIAFNTEAEKEAVRVDPSFGMRRNPNKTFIFLHEPH